MDQKVESFFERAQTFQITTLDEQGFPHTIAVSEPLIRHSFYDLKFYINAESKTADCIKRNRHGNIFCIDPLAHESLLLKGFLYLEDVSEYQGLSTKLDDFQKRLNYKKAKIATFETLTLKHYQNMEKVGLEIQAKR